MKKILNNQTALLVEFACEFNQKPSETVPDQSLSIKEIISRFASGKPLPQSETYYTDEVLPDIKKLDLVDIHELKQNITSNIEESKNKLTKAQTDNKRNEEERRFQSRHQELIKQSEKTDKKQED